MLELQRQFDDLQKETESLRAELEEAKTNSAIESVDQARAHEWSLRTLETEIEAQAQWRQSVAESLQQRLNEKAEAAEALRTSQSMDQARAHEWSLRTLETEMEAQAQWQQGVAESLQQRLNEKAEAADALRASESMDQARAHEWSLRTLETEMEAQAQWRQGVAESLQQRLNEKAEAADALRASESMDQARAHEWSLRTLETEIEAQAQWRQNVAELLQKRLDEKSKEADALRAENDELKANTIASAFNHADAKKTEGSLRSLEAEMEAQAQWRQRVAEDLERQLDDKTVEADSLRAEVLAARSEADAAELRAKLLTLEATATEAPTRIEELNAAAAAAAAATDEDTMHKAGEDDAVHLSASR
jgi:phosphate uptake regulator